MTNDLERLRDQDQDQDQANGIPALNTEQPLLFPVTRDNLNPLIIPHAPVLTVSSTSFAVKSVDREICDLLNLRCQTT